MSVEYRIEREAVRRAEAAGFYVRKVTWQGRVGAPDRLFSRADRPGVFIEFKAPDETAEPHQAREHEKMRAAGLEVHVCDSVADALHILGIG
jgi:hypothetical protein